MKDVEDIRSELNEIQARKAMYDYLKIASKEGRFIDPQGLLGGYPIVDPLDWYEYIEMCQQEGIYSVNFYPEYIFKIVKQ